jgi:hypothetical protein
MNRQRTPESKPGYYDIQKTIEYALPDIVDYFNNGTADHVMICQTDEYKYGYAALFFEPEKRCLKSDS